MRRTLGFSAAVCASLFLMSPAYAAPTGDELQGQTVDVDFSDGTRNTIYFGANGVATVTGPDGDTMDASWYVTDGQLCLQTSDAEECWAYTQRFVGGQAVAMASSCDANSLWTPRAVNPMMAEPEKMGERG